MLSTANTLHLTISKGNTKVGRIPNLSLTPVESCPGMTEACVDCYACAYMRRFTSTAVAYAKNLALCQDTGTDAGWKVDLIRFLSRTRPAAFRIHVAGDFFSVEYVQAWAQICRMFPQTRFLAFTRSWRIPELRNALGQLRRLPNVQTIASCDRFASAGPRGWRRAHMGKPTRATARKTVLCPGYGPKELTCDECGLCFKPVPVDVYFPIH